MDLKNTVIVLVRPDESRNVGSACRAMANCGIGTLRIVGARPDYDDGKVRALAVHAAEIWERAEFFASITEATRDCTLSAGTTRRRGKRRGRLLLPEEFAETASRAGGRIAVVFGNERTGLTEPELNECTSGVTIPSDDSFPSLNLSHAVQIVAYTLFRASAPASPSEPVALGRLDRTVGKIADGLASVGFFKLAGRGDMERFWRSVLSRAALTEGEADYIERTFDKMAGLSAKRAGGKPGAPAESPAAVTKS